MDTNTNKQVAIIGAGISGLLACKYTLSKGLRPVVFESRGGVGGVWTKTVETTRLQTPKPAYQFSDFPWPDSRDSSSFPTHLDILDYLTSYATHFDVLKCVRFNSKVVALRFLGGGGGDGAAAPGEYGSLLTGRPVWELAVQTNGSEAIQVVIKYYIYE